jgi:hypothetical protein
MGLGKNPQPGSFYLKRFPGRSKILEDSMDRVPRVTVIYLVGKVGEETGIFTLDPELIFKLSTQVF